jgi:phosphoglycolate phosphatase
MSASYARPIVLFDLDGTLTDPAYGITRSIAYALEKLGQPVADPDSLRRHIGPPLSVMFAEFGIEDERIGDAIAAYRERYTDVGMFENALIPGVHRLLDDLVARGSRLALATSKPDVHAEIILEHFAIRAPFDFVGGAALDGRRSHKADVVAHALQWLEYPDPDTVVMIGDREHDVFGARAHGIDTIGVLWGYGDRGELAAAGAAAIVDTVDELASLLLTSPGSAPLPAV